MKVSQRLIIPFLIIFAIGLNNQLKAGPWASFPCAWFRIGCSANVSGFVKPGFEPIRERFERLFFEGSEIGSAVCIYVDGEKVIDLIGGHTHLGNPKLWKNDTITHTYSSGKFVEGVLVAWLVDRGYLRYEDKIAKHWPEFGQNGKQDITVADLMGHRGVPNAPYLYNISLDDFLNEDKLAIELAKVKGHDDTIQTGYNIYHRGFYINELARRVDPKKRNLRQLVKEEFIDHLVNAQFTYGLEYRDYFRKAPFTPMSLVHLMARIIGVYIAPSSLAPDYFVRLKFMLENGNSAEGYHATLAKFAMPMDYIEAPEQELMANPLVTVPASQMSSFNSHTNARTLAQFAAILAGNGTFSGYQFLKPETVKMATKLNAAIHDRTFGFDIQYTVGGFGNNSIVNTKIPDYIGWLGAGGSSVVFSANRNIAFGYTPNGAIGFFGDYRSEVLQDALEECLKNLQKK